MFTVIDVEYSSTVGSSPLEDSFSDLSVKQVDQ
jgi:hypothetical protein